VGHRSPSFAAALLALVVASGCLDLNDQTLEDGGTDPARPGTGGSPGSRPDVSADVPTTERIDAPVPSDVTTADTTPPLTCLAKKCGDRCGECCDSADCPQKDGRIAACDASDLRCKYSCPGGQKDCNGICIASGACCADGDCPAKEQQVGKCDSSTHQCQWACAGNTRPCNGACIADTACCSDGDCSGNRACAGNACSTTCRSGFKQCGASCIDGNACCSDDECSGNRACTGGSCSSSCRAGFRQCDGACIKGCCNDNECSGNHTCSGGNCTSSCRAGFKACAGGTCIATDACCGGCGAGEVCKSGACAPACTPGVGAAAGCASAQYCDTSGGNRKCSTRKAGGEACDQSVKGQCKSDFCTVGESADEHLCCGGGSGGHVSVCQKNGRACADNDECASYSCVAGMCAKGR
jgi:hypothetical protein